MAKIISSRKKYVPALVSYTDSDKLYKFEGTVTLSND